MSSPVLWGHLLALGLLGAFFGGLAVPPSGYLSAFIQSLAQLLAVAQSGVDFSQRFRSALGPRLGDAGVVT